MARRMNREAILLLLAPAVFILLLFESDLVPASKLNNLHFHFSFLRSSQPKPRAYFGSQPKKALPGNGLVAIT